MKFKYYLMKVLAFLGTLYIAGACIALFVFIAAKGLPVLKLSLFFGDTAPFDAISGIKPVWDGIWPAAAGTLCLVALTMLLSLVPGLGCGIYLACFAKGKRKEYLSLAMDLLAGIPSIVMGLFGFVLILFLRKTIAPNATTSIALSAFCLALLVMPALVTSSRSSIESLPVSLKMTGAALGFTQNQSICHLLLPAASRGIISGVILSAGRAAEDTAVIMLTGVVVNSGLPAGLTAKFEALPFLIYYTAAQYTDEDELLRGFGSALVLLIFSAFLVGAAALFEKSMKRKVKGNKIK